MKITISNLTQNTVTLSEGLPARILGGQTVSANYSALTLPQVVALQEAVDNNLIVYSVANDSPDMANNVETAMLGGMSNGGFMDYNDTTGSVVLPEDEWVDIPNDGLGPFTNLGLAPDGVSQLVDTSTGQITPQELAIGDVLLIRKDYSIAPSANNSGVRFRYVLGAGLGEYTLEGNLVRLDQGAGVSYRTSLRMDMIYMGDANTRDNNIRPQVRLSSAGTLVNSGVVLTVLKRIP